MLNHVLSTPLSKHAAIKSRNNFAKRLYNCLFGKIVEVINEKTDFQNATSSIGVLDIAGFGRKFFFVVFFTLININIKTI